MRRNGLLFTSISTASICCQAASPSIDISAPTAVFLQAGTADGTRAISAGVEWDWSRSWRLSYGRVTGYWDLSMSRWSYATGRGRRSAWLGHIGIKPVVRWWPAWGDCRFFVEGGIGASITTNTYQTESKRFSTSFNFGDHIAVGARLGTSREHEVTLRVEHFSNAGIKHPNPGADFVQVRYTRRF